MDGKYWSSGESEFVRVIHIIFILAGVFGAAWYIRDGFSKTVKEEVGRVERRIERLEDKVSTEFQQLREAIFSLGSHK